MNKKHLGIVLVSVPFIIIFLYLIIKIGLIGTVIIVAGTIIVIVLATLVSVGIDLIDNN